MAHKWSEIRRRQYSEEIKREVLLHYPLCRTPEEKTELARELGIVDAKGFPSRAKLYNLWSRLAGRRGYGDILAAVRRPHGPQPTSIAEPVPARGSETRQRTGQSA